jgi:hypothetical protein
MLNAHFDFSSPDHHNHHREAIGELQQSSQVRNHSRHEQSDILQSGNFDTPEHRGHQGSRPRIQSQQGASVGLPALVPTQPPPSINVVIIFRPIRSEPITNEPIRVATPTTLSNPALQSLESSSVSAASPRSEEPATVSTVVERLEKPADQIRQDVLTSFQRGEVQSSSESESTDRSSDSEKIVDQRDATLNAHVEALDRWLTDFSRTISQISELDSTLDDLAIGDYPRTTGDDAILSETQTDRGMRMRSLRIDIESTVDEMIWLAPLTQPTTSCETNSASWSDDAMPEWNTGVGWYQSFEFVDQARMNSVLDESPPIVAAAASTSELVLDNAQQSAQARLQIPLTKSVSYAVVAIGVASWQVLQRRKRRGN